MAAWRGQSHGVDESQEHGQAEVVRDIRPLSQRLWQGLMEREGIAACAIAVSGASLHDAALGLVLVPLFCLLFLARCLHVRRARLPMRVPSGWGKTDYGDPSPSGGFRRARGICYLGNERGHNRELWAARDDILTHMLVLGTTGSGKTETLVSLAWNYLALGSGFLYVDPKAAPKLGAQIYTMCRILGRDDDFLVLSYMADRAGQESMRTRGNMRVPTRQSNTQNPLAVGTANQLTQLLLALMPADTGNNAIFSSNAQTLISGLMFVLVEMRDRGETPLSIGLLRTYLMDSEAMDRLARRTDLSEFSLSALQSAMATVGWNRHLSLQDQPRSFGEQFNYARAYFGRALGLLADNYGRIFRTTHGEVDAVDVITSRRVFVTLIPSMDKDPKELKNLGQICLASVRNACAVGLGEKVQGKLSEVLGALPTDARTPCGIIVDEYAAIETPGFEILLTQGRGLGIAVTVASQDAAGIRRASEAAAEQIVGNTKIKMFMTMEDPRQTFELVRALAGETWIYRTQGYSVDREGGGTAFRDNLSVGAERLARVDFRDLQKQAEGEMTLVFKGELIRGRTFYAAPPLAMTQEVRLSCHLKVHEPDVSGLRGRLHRLDGLCEAARACMRAVRGGGWRPLPGHAGARLARVAQDVACAMADWRQPAERAIWIYAGFDWEGGDPAALFDEGGDGALPSGEDLWLSSILEAQEDGGVDAFLVPGEEGFTDGGASVPGKAGGRSGLRS